MSGKYPGNSELDQLLVTEDVNSWTTVRKFSGALVKLSNWAPAKFYLYCIQIYIWYLFPSTFDQEISA